MKRLPVRIAVLALALTAACGPHVPLNLAVQEVPLSILLGLQQRPAAPATIALPPVTLPELLPPGFGPAPLPLPTPCPSAAPGAEPLVPASPDLLGRPVPGVYPVRLAGFWQPDTGKASAYAFAPNGTMTVSKPVLLLPQAPGGGTDDYTYTVTDLPSGADGTDRVETDFLVIPTNATESAPGGEVVTQAAGIYIKRIVTTGAHGTSTFAPSTPITYMTLPVVVGTGTVDPQKPNQSSWTTSGTDPATGTTLQLTGSVSGTPETQGTGRYRVDACGRVYDTWEVHATGTLTSPGENVSIDWYYDVATQYGGLEFRHTVRETGQFNGLTDPSTGLSQGSQVIDSITPEPQP